MADLKIGANVDVSPIGKLTSAAQEGGSAIAKMAQQFTAAGLSAEETKNALINLGYSAKETSGAMAALGIATEQMGEEAAAATTRVDAMTRALAYSSARLASNELGAGQFGFALARVGSISSAVAPVMAAAFPVFLATMLVDIIGQLVDKYETWSRLGMETTKHMDDLNISVETQTDKIELQNVKLENQIAVLREGVGAGNKLKEDALETKIAFEELGKAIDDDLDKINKILRSGYGTFSEIFAGKANVKATGEMLEPFERQYQLALLANDKQGQLNALLGEQMALEKALTEEEAKHVETRIIGPGPMTSEVGRGPDVEAVGQYKAALEAIESLKQRIYDLDEQGSLRQEKDQLDAAKRWTLLLEKIAEQTDKQIDAGVKKESEAFDKYLRLIETIDEQTDKQIDASIRKEIEAWTKKEELADKRFSEQERMTAETSRASLEANVEELHAIEEQAGARQISRTEELERLDELRSKLELQKEATQDLLRQEIAARAAARAAGTFGPEGSSSNEASKNREIALQRQLDELTKQFNRDLLEIDKTTAKLDTSWTTFWAKMRVNVQDFSTQFRVQMQTSINQVNSGIANAVTQWISYNKSFGASMRELGVSILNEFVSMFIKIGLQWLETQIMMKIAGKAIQSSSAVDRVVSEAAVAGAAGVASWAAAPWPIDAEAPAFGAAMMAAALSYVPLAAAERGGIVGGTEQLTLLHPREMVLPRNISESVQRAAAGGSLAGAGSAGHSISISYSPTIHGNVDSGMLASHSRDMQKMLRSELRRLNLT